jgi:hypothetical protein
MQFLSFSPSSDASSLFFISPLMPPGDPDSIFVHRNHAIGLAEAWLEAGPAMERFLSELGGVRCDVVSLPDGRSGNRWVLGSGNLVVLRRRQSSPYLRVAGAVLTVDQAESKTEEKLFSEFYLRFRPSR